MPYNEFRQYLRSKKYNGYSYKLSGKYHLATYTDPDNCDTIQEYVRQNNRLYSDRLVFLLEVLRTHRHP